VTHPSANHAAIGTVRALDLRAPFGSYAIDDFAGALKVNPFSLRADLCTAGNHAVNAVEIRRVDRCRAADGRRFLTSLAPQALYFLEVISRLGPEELRRVTISKTSGDSNAVDEAFRHADLCAKALRTVLDQRDLVKLPAGGGGEIDRLCIALIERLEIVWERATGAPAPRGASGRFVSFVAAAWQDLGLPDFPDKAGQPRDLVDAIGSRVVSRQRKNRHEKKCDRSITLPARHRHPRARQQG
jgi:hypothetical protein